MASYAPASPLPASGYSRGEVYAALRSALAGRYPDLHLFPILLPLAPAGRQPPAAGYALVAAVVAPDSRGSVRLASASPAQVPLIDPGFLRDGRDVDRLAEGLELARRSGAGPEFPRRAPPMRSRPRSGPGMPLPRPPNCTTTSAVGSAST
jgi:choline dehydrogenase